MKVARYWEETCRQVDHEPGWFPDLTWTTTPNRVVNGLMVFTLMWVIMQASAGLLAEVVRNLSAVHLRLRVPAF